MKTCAQLTKTGWINITEEEFDSCGNGKDKAFALFCSNHDYSGGGGQFHVGIDYDTRYKGPDYVEWDDNNGIESYWPSAEDAAGYAANNMESDLDTDVPERKALASMMLELLGDAAITEAA